MKKIFILIVCAYLIAFFNLTIFASSETLIGKMFCSDNISYDDILYKVYSDTEQENISENIFLEEKNVSLDGKLYSNFNSSLIIEIELSTIPIGYGVKNNVFKYTNSSILVNIEKIDYIEINNNNDEISFYNEFNEKLIAIYNDSLLNRCDIQHTSEENFIQSPQRIMNRVENSQSHINSNYISYNDLIVTESVCLDESNNIYHNLRFIPVSLSGNDYEKQIANNTLSSYITVRKNNNGQIISTSENIYQVIVNSVAECFKFLYNKFHVIPSSENNYTNFYIYVYDEAFSGSTYHDSGQYVLYIIPKISQNSSFFEDIVFLTTHEVVHLFEHALVDDIDNLESINFNESFAEFIGLYYSFFESQYDLKNINPSTFNNLHSTTIKKPLYEKYYFSDEQIYDFAENPYAFSLSNHLFINNSNIHQNMFYSNASPYSYFLEIKSLYESIGNNFWSHIKNFLQYTTLDNENTNDNIDLQQEFYSVFSSYITDYIYNLELNQCFFAGGEDSYPENYKNLFTNSCFEKTNKYINPIVNYSVYSYETLNSLAKQSFSRFKLNTADSIADQSNDILYNLDLTYYCNMRIDLLSKDLNGNITTTSYPLIYNGSNGSLNHINMSLIAPKYSITYLFVCHNDDITDSTTSFESAVMNLSKIDNATICSAYDNNKIYTEIISKSSSSFTKELLFNGEYSFKVENLSGASSVKLFDANLNEVTSFVMNNLNYINTNVDTKYYLWVDNIFNTTNVISLEIAPNTANSIFFDVSQNIFKDENDYIININFESFVIDFFKFNIQRTQNVIGLHSNFKHNNNIISKFDAAYYSVPATYTSASGNALLISNTAYSLNSSFIGTDDFEYRLTFGKCGIDKELNSQNSILFQNNLYDSDFVYCVKVGELISSSAIMQVISGYSSSENINSSYVVMVMKKTNGVLGEVGGFSVSDNNVYHYNYNSFTVYPDEEIYVFMHRDIVNFNNYIEISLLN